MKKSWDYKKYNYRFYHIIINEVTWFLYRDKDRYFFSTEEPSEGEPTELPDGFDVKIDKNTKTPNLIKKISVGQAVDDFFANKPDKDKEKKSNSQKKKRKMPSEIRDKYHRWKY